MGSVAGVVEFRGVLRLLILHIPLVLLRVFLELLRNVVVVFIVLELFESGLLLAFVLEVLLVVLVSDGLRLQLYVGGVRFQSRQPLLFPLLLLLYQLQSPSLLPLLSRSHDFLVTELPTGEGTKAADAAIGVSLLKGRVDFVDDCFDPLCEGPVVVEVDINEHQPCLERP